MNRLMIIGRLTKDIELRYTNSNMPTTKLSLAVNNGKDKNGNQDTTFLDLDVFNKQAENCVKYLRQGSLVSAECIVKNNNYEKKDGTKIYGFSFIANNVMFLDTKPKTETTQTPEPQQEQESDPFTSFGKEIRIEEQQDLDDNFLE